MREAQAFARGLTAFGNALSISVGPRFCAATDIKPESMRFSVLIALPGAAGLEPVIDNETLANALAASGGHVPACAGHSG